MTDDDLCFTPALELRAALDARELTSEEITRAVLDRIDRVDSAINAFVTVTADLALDRARECDRERAAADDPRELPLLHGLPISVKDLTDTAGIRTTYGSVPYRDHVPTKDSVSWRRIKDAGAVLVGKTTTPEFGLLGVTESPLTGATNNPWKLDRTVGGSSGGAAAATAAGLAPLAWGSDGSGSIRIPAAYCGVVGMKPSAGRVPSEELIVYDTASSSGPIARTVADAALLLQATAGPHTLIPTSLPATGDDYVAAARQASVKGLRVAYSPDLGWGPIDPAVREGFEQALTVFERDLGATVEFVEFDLPDPIEFFIDFWAPQFAGMIEEDPNLSFEEAYPSSRTLIERAREMSATDWWRVSHSVRSERALAVGQVFENFDLLLTPTSPVPAFPHPGQDVAGNLEVDGIPTSAPAIDFHRLTALFNDTGHPAITVLGGFSPDGLPLGLQVVATHHADALAITGAAAYEQATDWLSRRPPIR